MPIEKRKNEESTSDRKSKKTYQQDHADALSPFTVGVFVTCVRGKEQAALKDALDLFNDYAERHELGQNQSAETEDDADELDIEQAIASELGTIQAKPSGSTALFTPLKTATECVLFIKTAKSIDPVELVHGICTEAQKDVQKKIGGRFLRRMTPITTSADASIGGLKQCLDKVLPKEFSGPPRRFRIEPNFRSHNVLNRDMVIPEIANRITILGCHKVDLKDYDALVMVQVMRSFLGVSVVRDWERLRKFNLSEIYTSDHAEEPQVASTTDDQSSLEGSIVKGNSKSKE